MNAVTAFEHPLSLMDAAPEPQQRQLLNELARSRTRLVALARELHEVQSEIESLAPQRKRHELAMEVCASLDKLADADGADLFWGAGTSAEQSTEHVRGVRARVEEFGQWMTHIEARRAAIEEQIRKHGDLVDAIEHALFEAQDEEERLKYEWEIEREIDEAPRTIRMPWTHDGEDDRRYRKSAMIAMLLCVLFTGIAALVELPQRVAADGPQVPERVVRLLMEERPAPPPVREAPKPKPPEQVAEPQPEEKPVQQRVARVDPQVPQETAPEEPAAEEQGILAFRAQLAASKDDDVVGRLGAQAHIDNADYKSSGRAERSMLTTSAPGSSGGINLASLSRGVGGAGGDGLAGVQVTRASSAIAAVGAPGGDRPLSGDGATPGRTDEEIQIVFDRYKATLYRIYNKELRNDPTLRGQVVLRLTIEPDGSVSLCELQSSDMNAPQLAGQVVARVKSFDFGAKAVPAITILYPIDFLPAA